MDKSQLLFLIRETVGRNGYTRCVCMRARSGSRQHQDNAYARVDFGHAQTTPILNLIV